MSSRGYKSHIHSASDLCHSAFIDPTNCFTIFTRSHSFVHGAFQVPTTMVQVLVKWRICLLVDVRVCGVECDHAVALIDDAEYGNNCGMWTSNLWCVLREF